MCNIRIMRLHEIIAHNDNNHDEALLLDVLAPYKRQLFKYYQGTFTSEPMLMVVSITNACQYVKIVPSGEFMDAVYAYLDKCYDDIYMEEILANSIPMEDWVKL